MLLISTVNAETRRLTGQLCVVELMAWGILYYTFSVLLAPMTSELGWSKATLALGFSIALLVSGTAAPAVGQWIDERGSREIMSVGLIVGALGLGLWSLSATVHVYLVAWFLIGLGMATTLYAPAFATIVRFDANNSRNSILMVTLAGGLASTLFFPVSNYLAESLGWREALQVLAVGLVIIGVPLTLSIPRATRRASYTKHTPMRPEGTPRAFVTLTGTFMLANMGGTAINVYLIIFLIERGQTLQAAALIAGTAGIAKIAGRLAITLGQNFSALALLKVSLIASSAAILLPLFWPATWALITMVTVFGALSGARTILRPLLIVELFGHNRFGKSNGIIQFFTTVAKSAGPVLMGLLIVELGWTFSWLFGAGIMLASAALLFTLRLQPVSIESKPEVAA